MKPFPLFNLKDKYLTWVFKEMNLIDLVELSLASVKSRQKIRDADIRAESLTFCEEWISLKFPWKEDPLFFLFSGETDQIQGYRVIHNSNFFWATNHDENTITCFTKTVEKYRKALNYFVELFQVETFDCTVSQPFLPKRLLELPRVVQNMKFEESMTDPIEIGKVMDRIEVRDEVEVMGEIEELHEKMLTVPSIFLGNASKLTVEQLSKLNNSTIEVSQHQMTSQDVNFLIKSWKSSKSSLKYLKIYDEEEAFDLEEILEGTGSHAWDQTKRDQMYDLNGEEVDLSEYMDVERESDGRIASIGLVGDLLEVMVWDFEEKEEEPEPEAEAKEPVIPAESDSQLIHLLRELGISDDILEGAEKKAKKHKKSKKTEQEGN